MSIIKENRGYKIFGDLQPFEAKPQVWNKHHGRLVPEDAVYIGRGSPWGNPYTVAEFGRDKAIELYRTEALPYLDVTSLKGKHLVCFCKPLACHGDLILAKANG